MAQAILLGATIVATASLIVLGSLAIFAGLWRGSVRMDLTASGADHEAVFIFRDGQLVDCSDSARKLLTSLEGSADPGRKAGVWTVLQAYLAPRFPDLDDALAGLASSGQIEIGSAAGDGLLLTARFHSGLTELRLNDTAAEGALLAIDRLSFDALQAEVKTLRAVARHSPTLIWKTDPEGQIVWANATYIKALQQGFAASGDLTWPLPALFQMPQQANDGRISLVCDETVYWFAHKHVAEGACELHFATAIDEAVQSEAARQQTLQTLTRTFASLPIGLALFDAERRLQVFNPALVDLTGMSPTFLTARPSFEQILYTLRENRMLPEPKDFRDWRREIIEMEKAAETGEYAEEWCLDGGRTFHVTGRPQPNGAIALFIEDVTTEAALTRSFRSEIEVVHRVLDGLPEGIAVFGMSGQALLANDAYVRLWQTDPCAKLSDGGLGQAISFWSDRCEPTTFWARLAEFVSHADQVEEITGSATLRGGMPMVMRARRLAGGAFMLGFQTMSVTLRPQMTARALGADLSRSADLASPRRDTVLKDVLSDLPAPEDAIRKPRSARHSGNRVRV